MIPKKLLSILSIPVFLMGCLSTTDPETMAQAACPDGPAITASEVEYDQIGLRWKTCGPGIAYYDLHVGVSQDIDGEGRVVWYRIDDPADTAFITYRDPGVTFFFRLTAHFQDSSTAIGPLHSAATESQLGDFSPIKAGNSYSYDYRSSATYPSRSGSGSRTEGRIDFKVLEKRDTSSGSAYTVLYEEVSVKDEITILRPENTTVVTRMDTVSMTEIITCIDSLNQVFCPPIPNSLAQGFTPWGIGHILDRTLIVPNGYDLPRYLCSKREGRLYLKDVGAVGENYKRLGNGWGESHRLDLTEYNGSPVDYRFLMEHYGLSQ